MTWGAMRRFLFLQGPHGPFLSQLARALRATGADVHRIGFNAGDRAMWRGPGFTGFHGAREDWPAFLADTCARHGITDLLCYGSTRWMHRDAAAFARASGLRLHLVEEGYLRPFWITYERDGANGDSLLASLSLADMARALDTAPTALHEAPDRWGDLRAHMVWGAAYHAALLAGRRHWPAFTPHRSPGPAAEARLHLRKLATLPLRMLARRHATARLLGTARPYHLVLLQLAHDANFLDHSPFRDQAGLIDLVLAGFATGAPAHHVLAFKAHPLEDGREPLRPLIDRLARAHGLSDRVVFLPGGKLGPLLDHARTAVTVNSTSAHQALWRGLPLKALGRSVYDRPEFVSDQPLPEFFAAPRSPDRDAYALYRAFLLRSSQVPGGFYSRAGRRQLLRQLPDLLLAPTCPYAALTGPAAAPQHKRALAGPPPTPLEKTGNLP